MTILAMFAAVFLCCGVLSPHLKGFVRGSDVTISLDEEITGTGEPVEPGVGDRRRKRSVNEACQDPPQSSATPEQIRQFVDTHNEARSAENAANMMRMSWDAEIASMAQAWADQCDFSHNYTEDCYGNSLGQNVWMSSSNSVVNMATPTVSWLNEKHDYHYPEMTCDGVCGHYTQAVWYDSAKIGCGVTVCPSIRVRGDEPWINATIVVCDYFKPGNYRNHLPFELSLDVCTNCPVENGHQCIDGLCVACIPENDMDVNCECNRVCPFHGVLDEGTCTCYCEDGYFDNAGVCQLCEDVKSQYACNYWKDLEYCLDSNVYHNFMTRKCPKTCGFC